jgi:hypothetical protein
MHSKPSLIGINEGRSDLDYAMIRISEAQGSLKDEIELEHK